MKKTFFKKISLFFLVVSFSSCEKEMIEVETQSNNTSEGSIQNRNGVLIFKDYEQMESTNNHLLLLKAEDVENWEIQNQFISLATIDRKINEEEVQHQESFFKGLDPNLSINEYKSRGYNYEHSNLYKIYLNKGTIIRTIDDNDGSISTTLSVTNHAYLNILNEEGKVIIGNELIVFQGDTIYRYDKSTNKLITNNDKSTSQKLNNEFNFNKGTGSASNRWITDPAKGSNYRYYGRVIFSSIYTTSSLSQTFYWEARAEQKKFGNWNTRNDYNPIWGCSAYWSYDYWIIYPGAGYGIVRDGSQYPLPNSLNRPTSPYNVSNLNTNYTKRPLQFSDMYTINPLKAGYSFFDNVRVYNYNFVFKYSGGSSGYNYTAY